MREKGTWGKKHQALPQIPNPILRSDLETLWTPLSRKDQVNSEVLLKSVSNSHIITMAVRKRKTLFHTIRVTDKLKFGS